MHLVERRFFGGRRLSAGTADGSGAADKRGARGGAEDDSESGGAEYRSSAGGGWRACRTMENRLTIRGVAQSRYRYAIKHAGAALRARQGYRECAERGQAGRTRNK